MPLNLKELIVVLGIAFAIFRLAKPIALVFMAEEDFSRRRNAWYVLTAVAFLSPNFWWFALIAIPVYFVVGRKDSNPGAFYLMLLNVVPQIPVQVPMVGMPYLFLVDNYLLLSFCVMTPAALRLLRSKDETRIRGLQTMDYCLIAYGGLTAALYLHAENGAGGVFPATFTSDLRNAFVFFFSIFIPYFTISRSASNRRAFLELMATYCLTCAVFAGIALFESVRHWLLYAELPQRWGYIINFTLYVTRGESLRAMAAAGHSLTLGHLLVTAFGFWLYLQSEIKSKVTRLAVIILWWLGLIAAYSRGPWLAAVLVYFVFAALRPHPLPNLLKAAGLGAIAALLVSLSPLRDKFVSVLPFLGGTVDSGNLVYRQRLRDRAWQIISESPLLGDQTALLKMQELRQGQGIIDVVNSYIQVLLANGFVGLSLFLSFILMAVLKAWTVSRKITPIDPDFGLLGASLVACILATLLLMQNGSFGMGTERLYYLLAALAAAYAHMGRSRRRDASGYAR
jgi:O-antigen ligase